MIVSCSNCQQTYDPAASSSPGRCPECGFGDERITRCVIPPESDLPENDGSFLTHSVSFGKPEATGSESPQESRQWIGATFGDYEIIDRLGQGGMGQVFLAYQRSANRKVALKVIRIDKLDDLNSHAGQELTARFMSEARAVAHLEHENIVTVYEIGQVESHHFFSMQLVNGKSLSKLIKEDTLTDKEIAQIMLPVCRALQHAHSRGILHRDIKPANIMLDENLRPFITDFGLAKWFEDQDNSMTRSGQVVGTVSYMSPEQAVDSANVTIACDIYSMGATIYHMLTGRPPFTKGSFVEVLRKVIDEEPSRPSTLVHHVDVDLETIALKCLEKDPESRYRTADELGDDLQRFLNGRPILARPVGQAERFWRWCKRSPWIAGLGASAILLLLTTLVASLIGYVNVSNSNRETRQQLRESLLLQAQAMHSSTEAGRRERALEALRQAAIIETGPDLRDEYVRYLDQPDIEVLHDIPIAGWDQNGAGYAEGIGPDAIIAVTDGGKPIEISIQSGTIVNRFDQIGPFRRDENGQSSFLARASRDGRYLAGNSLEKNAIEIWDLTKRVKLGVLENEAGEPIQTASLVFDADGSGIFCAGKQNSDPSAISFFRFSIPDLQLLTTWEEKAFSVDSLQVVDHKQLVARLGDAGTMRLVTWEQEQLREPPLETGDYQFDSAFGANNLPRAITIDSDFRRLYAGNATGSVTTFVWPSIEPVLPQPLMGRHAKNVLAVDVSRNGRWLVTSGGDRQLKIWDKLAGTVVTQIELDSPRASNVQWLPDGETLLSDTNQGLRIWRFVPPISQQFLIKDDSGVPQVGFLANDIEFAPKTDTLFYYAGGFFSRVDVNNTEHGFELIKQGLHWGNEIFVSQDGNQWALFSTYMDGEIATPLEILSLQSPAVVSIVPSPNSRVVNLSQLDDGRFILTQLVNDNVLRVSELDSEKELLKLEFGELVSRSVNPHVAVAADGRRLAVQTPNPGSDDSLKVFDLDSGQVLFQTMVGWAFFQMDSAGRRLVYRDGTDLVVVNVDSGHELFKLNVKPANRLVISGDGGSLAVMDATEGKIQLFDDRYELDLTLLVQQVLPVWIALSKTGKWLAICDRTGAVRLWNLDKLQDELRRGGIVQ